MQGSLLSDVVVLFCVGVSTVFEEESDHIGVLVHDGDVEGSAPVDILTVDFGLLVWVRAGVLSRRLMASTALEWETAWNSRLLPGYSGSNILFMQLYNYRFLLTCHNKQLLRADWIGGHLCAGRFWLLIGKYSNLIQINRQITMNNLAYLRLEGITNYPDDPKASNSMQSM